MLALELGVVGLMNVQFAVKGGEVYVLEVNPRASRTVPFVSKATGRAAREDRGAGDGREDARRARRSPTGEVPRHVAVKESVFPFAKFPGADTILGPEMRSTGEVMGIDARRSRAPSPRARWRRDTAAGRRRRVPERARRRQGGDGPSSPAGWSRSASRWWRRTAPPRWCARRGCRAPASTRCSRATPHYVDAMRTSSARSSSSSTRPRATRRSGLTRNRCGGRRCCRRRRSRSSAR